MISLMHKMWENCGRSGLQIAFFSDQQTKTWIYSVYSDLKWRKSRKSTRWTNRNYWMFKILLEKWSKYIKNYCVDWLLQLKSRLDSNLPAVRLETRFDKSSNLTRTGLHRLGICLKTCSDKTWTCLFLTRELLCQDFIFDLDLTDLGCDSRLAFDLKISTVTQSHSYSLFQWLS